MIDRDVIAFLDGRRVAVSIASRSKHCIPSVTRALGYRISADARASSPSSSRARPSAFSRT